jgi:hypothetical protein
MISVDFAQKVCALVSFISIPYAGQCPPLLPLNRKQDGSNRQMLTTTNNSVNTVFIGQNYLRCEVNKKPLVQYKLEPIISYYLQL